jgi:uncharacterized protein YqeY
MTIQQTVKKDLAAAMKARNEARKNALRVVMGEFARAEGKELTDDEAIRILKKLAKSGRETIEQSKSTGDAEYLEIIESYLPRAADEAEIRAWIDVNIDFSQFKNKMQAMRPIMTHFGSSAEGDTVKKILQTY